MTRWIIAYAVAIAVYAAGDMSWISLTGPVIYRPALGPLLAPTFDLHVAVAFYLLYATGLLVFGCAPGLRSGSWLEALASGALFGLVAYGTYDLTNEATLKVWSASVSLIDMAWGALISGLASAVGCRAGLMLGQP